MSWWDRQNRAADAYNIRLREIQAAQDTAEANREALAASKEPGNLPGLPPGRMTSGGGTLATQTPGAENAAKASALREARESAELGSPESYKTPVGTAAAPQPAEVIRGMQRTYAAPAPAGEGMLQEYSNPLRAQQAYNRARGVGEFVSVSGEPERNRALARGLDVETAQKQETNRIANQTALWDKTFKPQHFTYNKEKKTYEKPEDENLNNLYEEGLSHIRSGMTADQAEAAIMPKLHQHYLTPDNINKTLDYFAQKENTTVTPERRAKALAMPPEELLPRVLEALRAPQPGFFSNTFRRPTTTPEEQGSMP